MRYFILLCSFFVHFFSSLNAYELTIATMFRNAAPFLKEWVEYHHMVGVDHFWLYNDESTDNWEEILKPYIDQGLVEVFHWPAPKPNWGPGQHKAFEDGIKRARETKTTWIALIDIDEFILPMQERTIKECLKKHFSKATAVYANWRNFGTGGVYLSEGDSMLFRLTACSLREHPANWNGKSIVRPTCVSDHVGYVHHYHLTNGGKYFNGDGQEMNMVDGKVKPDANHHDTYIRINHYPLGDENYFQNVRLPRDNWKKSTMERYEAFSLDNDDKIIEFIRTKHPKTYRKIWKASDLKASNTEE
jgi:hypothetical protein